MYRSGKSARQKNKASARTNCYPFLLPIRVAAGLTKD
jgi:hypothetical protein